MTQKNFKQPSLLVGVLRRTATAQAALSPSSLLHYTRSLPPERDPHECADTRDRNAGRPPYDGFTESWD